MSKAEDAQGAALLAVQQASAAASCQSLGALAHPAPVLNGGAALAGRPCSSAAPPMPCPSCNADAQHHVSTVRFCLVLCGPCGGHAVPCPARPYHAVPCPAMPPNCPCAPSGRPAHLAMPHQSVALQCRLHPAGHGHLPGHGQVGAGWHGRSQHGTPWHGTAWLPHCIYMACGMQ